MNMTKQIINPENWVDTELEISTNDDNTILVVYDERYKLVETDCVGVKHLLNSEDIKVVSVYTDYTDSFTVMGGGFTFSDKNPLIACAKFLGNIG